MMERRASAVGGISDLRKFGAVEGVHYRVVKSGEEITGFPVAFDIGPMVELMKLDEDTVFMPGPDFDGFAVVNAAGMKLVGCPLIAGAMRAGSLPAEVAYLTKADE
jgi:hypothetical protein